MIDQKNPMREDEPGYIAKAFVRIFPFGVGDYHERKSSLGAGLKYATWAKYVLQYHDGRAARHPRFKYFVLNTRLRMKTPGLKNVFYRSNEEAAGLTMDDLQDPEMRRKLMYLLLFFHFVVDLHFFGGTASFSFHTRVFSVFLCVVGLH